MDGKTSDSHWELGIRICGRKKGPMRKNSLSIQTLLLSSQERGVGRRGSQMCENTNSRRFLLGYPPVFAGGSPPVLSFLSPRRSSGSILLPGVTTTPPGTSRNFLLLLHHSCHSSSESWSLSLLRISSPFS